MARLALLLASLVPLATSQFVPPQAILQAGYPSGFRAFIPDFPGCQQFAFHGKINSPFIQSNELGSIFQEILRPQNGFWIVQDFKLILNPGDIIHYWTNTVKDGVDYPKHNQTWKVPGPEGSVDILSPIKPLKKTPEKVKKTKPSLAEEPTTPKIDTPSTSSDATASTNSDATAPTDSDATASTNSDATAPTDSDATASTNNDATAPTDSDATASTNSDATASTNSDESVPTSIDEITPSSSETSTPTTTDTKTKIQTSPLTTKLNPTTVQTTPSTKKPIPTTTQTPYSTTKSTTTTVLTTPVKTTTTPPTTKRNPTSEKRDTQNPKISANSPLAEEVEELTTPFSSEKPLSSEFPEESPLFPFPGLYPRPFKPMMPSEGPGFEICSNPWNFEERIGETRTQKLERQVAKLQCQLALFQRGYNQLSNTVESELTDLKKLMYGMVSRMANLESVLRSTPFG